MTILKPTVLVKDFNIPQTAQTAWLTFEDLNNEELLPEGGEFRYCIVALMPQTALT